MSFILLKTYSNYLEASISVSLLQEENINCHIENENTVTLMGMHSGIQLMVHQSQAERALEVIAIAEETYLSSIVCPNCGHKGFSTKQVTEDHGSALKNMPFGKILGAMARLFSKEGTTMQVKHYVCNRCKKEFEELPL